jgi:Cytochrome c554 and c-prime/Doubled CXXCH motif (Paired_CXXCH_1)
MKKLLPSLFGVLAGINLFVVSPPAAMAAEYTAVPVTQTIAVPDYVGSQTCAACHADQAEQWQDSDHALAWTLPDETTVLGDFNDASITFQGVTARFTRQDSDFYVETQGADGEMRDFKVAGVVGVEPLQQYLLETEPGKLQTLDIAWDVPGERWYFVFPDQVRPPDDGLHWTGSYKNFNARCADCHATGFEKNYDPETRSYASTQSEIGVGCEACHGPGKAHQAWAQDPEGYDPALWPGLSPIGLTIDYAAGDAETEIQQCAACHSRREAFGDGNPTPGTAFNDAYRLALLRPELYEVDGTIVDEVYVYGSFLQSKMYAAGVTCSDCHNPHEAALELDVNATCAQCHSPAGNPRFPDLKLAEYDDPAHYFHPADSAAASCAACHMTERTYMGVDARSDHNFRIPRPDLSMQTGASNTCVDCHTDRDAAWAAQEIAMRFPDTGQRGPNSSLVFAAARLETGGDNEGLIALAEYTALPGITRASALEMLRNSASEAIAARAAPLIMDPDPLVRAAAVALQRRAAPRDRVQRIVGSFEDPVKLVRIAAAREFLDAPVARLPDRIDKAARISTDEWRASLFIKTDFPETNMVIGGMQLVLRNVDGAEQAFREAVQLDPQLVRAWVMIARIRVAIDDMGGARMVLDEALAANPNSEFLQSLRMEAGQ